MACLQYAARLTLAILLLQCAIAAAAQLRGVDPALAHIYAESSGTFQCRDRSKSILFSQVNDDYCDCFDGSDEPGTSACGNGSFYCRNKGFESKVIASSFVDDGVCDCCDGADELEGCSDTCVQQGLAALDSVRTALAAKQKGLEVKQQYIAQAAGIIQGWKDELEGLGPKIEAKQQQTDMLKAELDAAEAHEKKLREIEQARKKKEEEEAAARKAAEEAQRAAEGGEQAAAGGEEGAVEEETLIQRAQRLAREQGVIPQQQQQQQGGDAQAGSGSQEAQAGSGSQEAEGGQPQHQGEGGEGEQAATGGVGEEEDAEELGRRIASQWISSDSKDGEAGDQGADGAAGDDVSDDDASLDDEESEDAEGGEGKGDDQMDGIHHDDYADDYYPPPTGHYDDEDMAVDDWVPPPPAEPVPEKGFFGKLRARFEGFIERIFSTGDGRGTGSGGGGNRTSSEVRPEWSAANRELKELSDRKAELEKRLANDYGPQQEFAAIAYKCLDGKFDKYTYSVCLYEKAAQKEGGGSTNLGSWNGWEDGFGVAKFTNGQHCWQGPNRSLKVSLECNAADAVLKVEEPSRCEYSAVLHTPAACQQQEVDDLRAELAAKEAAVRGAAPARTPPPPAVGSSGDEDEHDEL